MSDRKLEASGSDDRPDLAIPDGGLGTSMPAWLQQRPEWATSSREAGKSVEPELPSVMSGASRELPPPDESPIHLDTILVVGDLPEWLQAVARRSNCDTETGESLDETSNGGEMMARDTETELPVADLPISPTCGGELPVIPEETAAPSKVGSDPKSFWRNDGVIGGLVAAIVMMLIYVILVTTGIL